MLKFRRRRGVLFSYLWRETLQQADEDNKDCYETETPTAYPNFDGAD